MATISPTRTGPQGAPPKGGSGIRSSTARDNIVDRVIAAAHRFVEASKATSSPLTFREALMMAVTLFACEPNA